MWDSVQYSKSSYEAMKDKGKLLSEKSHLKRLHMLLLQVYGVLKKAELEIVKRSVASRDSEEGSEWIGRIQRTQHCETILYKVSVACDLETALIFFFNLMVDICHYAVVKTPRNVQCKKWIVT